MSDLRARISDDIDRYVDLCELYSEEVQFLKDWYGNSEPDCYGKHASMLEQRKRFDIKSKKA